ncbi:hypothetical protein [Peribacillus loiseleuriae]|uniref:hypothetical protein n=1 Tax=Peribacillus loiseleuriae TaxID=1679170 RepID=UPI000A80A99B
MKRMPFERPTDYYDERIFSIDEQICSLLKQRKELSNNNPGFPPLENISHWAEKFGLHEDLLRLLFGELRNDEEFRPRVEPTGFQRNLPILKLVEKGKYLYSVPCIRQYENASVVNLDIHWDATNDSHGDTSWYRFLELFVGDYYDCRVTGGGGSEGHITYNFIVSPTFTRRYIRV